MNDFILHTTTEQPVADDVMVSYRTICDGVISRPYLPIEAKNLNWSSETTFGKIHDYKVVKVPRIVSSVENHVSETDRHVEGLPLIGFC